MNKETQELFQLMDQVPNARRVAIKYRRLIRKGKLDPSQNVEDGGAGWLEMEDHINRADCVKTYSYWTLGIILTIVLIALGVLFFIATAAK
ncbi:hypothetical protein [Chitinophaga sp. MM2321]|uniref:hypothetical protein n=1 Tax=Chitinophaga sp. MM2321 TaxID=3137178 RepID=UPI0032D5AB9E